MSTPAPLIERLLLLDLKENYCKKVWFQYRQKFIVWLLVPYL